MMYFSYYCHTLYVKFVESVGLLVILILLSMNASSLLFLTIRLSHDLSWILLFKFANLVDCLALRTQYNFYNI